MRDSRTSAAVGVRDGGYNRMMRLLRRSLPDPHNVVLGIALLVFLASVSGLVATTVARGHELEKLPGFALYNSIVSHPITDRPAVAVLPPEVESSAPVERLAAPVLSLSIPAINIVAPLVPMGVRTDGYMDLPNSPHDVAWYQFTSKPGMGGNAVFSAHVDYIDFGPAVFWNLSKLKVGDDVSIRLRDGSLINYVVTTAKTIPLQALDVESTIAPTEQESVTLITCSGEFSQGNYSHRVVIHAVRTSAQRGS